MQFSNVNAPCKTTAPHGRNERDDLSLVDIGFTYDRHGPAEALRDVSFTVSGGGLWTLLGPSGSGKSTLLRIIGGYVFPNRGKVLLGNRDITRVLPRRRDMGMIFQDYALFPHMTVFDNVAYGLRARKLEQKAIRERVGQMLQLVQLQGMEQRYPSQLSGGQQQRVALARAFAIRPSVMLMDEAMGALDLKLREMMAVEVRAIQREMGTTTIHVTHDQGEAMTMSDRIVIINKGRVMQIGTPEELIAKPANRFVAEFIGSNNVIPVTVGSGSERPVTGVISGLEGALVLTSVMPAGVSGPECYLVVPSEKIEVSGASASGGIPGTVTATKYVGTSRSLLVSTASNHVIVAQDQGNQFSRGDAVRLSWSPEASILVNDPEI